MRLFFERTETQNEIIVVHKPYFLYLFFLAIAIWVVAGVMPGNQALKSIAGFASFFAIIVLVWRFISMRRVWAEIREAMQRGGVVVSGTKFNPINPFTIRIPKRPS